MSTKSEHKNQCDPLPQNQPVEKFKLISNEEMLESVDECMQHEIYLESKSLTLIKNASATSDVSANCSTDSDESNENIRNRMAYLQNWLKSSFSQQFPSNSSINKIITSISNVTLCDKHNATSFHHDYNFEYILSNKIDSKPTLLNCQHTKSEVEFGMTLKNPKPTPVTNEITNNLTLLRGKLSACLESQIDLIPDKDLIDIYNLLPENGFNFQLAGDYQINSNFKITKSCYTNFCGDGVLNNNFQVYPVLLSSDEIEHQRAGVQSSSLENIDQQLHSEFDNLERIYKNIYVNLDKVLHLNDFEINDKRIYSGSIDDIENDLKGVLDELKSSLATMEENFYHPSVVNTEKCTSEKIQTNETFCKMENEIQQIINELKKESYYIKETAISSGAKEEDMIVCVDHSESIPICSDILNSIVDNVVNTKNEVEKSLSSTLPYRTFQSGDISDSNRKKAVYFCTTTLNSKVPKTSFSFGEGVPPSRSITKSLQRRREGRITPGPKMCNEISNIYSQSNYAKHKNDEKIHLINPNKIKYCDNFTNVESTDKRDNEVNSDSVCCPQNPLLGVPKSRKITKLGSKPIEEQPSTSYSVEPAVSDEEIVLKNTFFNSSVQLRKCGGAIPKTSFKSIAKTPLSSSDEDVRNYERQIHVQKRKSKSSAQSDEVSVKATRAYPDLRISNELLPRSLQISDLSFTDAEATDTDYEGDIDTLQLHFFHPTYRYTSNHELNSPEEILEIEKNVLQNLKLQQSNKSEYDYSFSCNLSLNSHGSMTSNPSNILQVIDITDKKTSNTPDDIETPEL